MRTSLSAMAELISPVGSSPEASGAAQAGSEAISSVEKQAHDFMSISHSSCVTGWRPIADHAADIPARAQVVMGRRDDRHGTFVLRPRERIRIAEANRA